MVEVNALQTAPITQQVTPAESLAEMSGGAPAAPQGRPRARRRRRFRRRRRAKDREKSAMVIVTADKSPALLPEEPQPGPRREASEHRDPAKRQAGKQESQGPANPQAGEPQVSAAMLRVGRIEPGPVDSKVVDPKSTFSPRLQTVSPTLLIEPERPCDLGCVLFGCEIRAKRIKEQLAANESPQLPRSTGIT